MPGIMKALGQKINQEEKMGRTIRGSPLWRFLLHAQGAQVLVAPLHYARYGVLHAVSARGKVGKKRQ
jgi:hypothetical protein